MTKKIKFNKNFQTERLYFILINVTLKIIFIFKFKNFLTYYENYPYNHFKFLLKFFIPKILKLRK